MITNPEYTEYGNIGDFEDSQSPSIHSSRRFLHGEDVMEKFARDREEYYKNKQAKAREEHKASYIKQGMSEEEAEGRTQVDFKEREKTLEEYERDLKAIRSTNPLAELNSRIFYATKRLIF